MWPFRRKLSASIFTWCRLFLKILENEIWNFGRNLRFGHIWQWQGYRRSLRNSVKKAWKKIQAGGDSNPGLGTRNPGLLGSALTNEALILDKINRKFRLPPPTLAIYIYTAVRWLDSFTRYFAPQFEIGQSRQTRLTMPTVRGLGRNKTLSKTFNLIKM